MAAASWLFVKGPESIRVVRQTGTVLNISGPGRARSEHRFDGEAEVQAYQVRLAEEFSAAGFILIGENHERRSGRERRSMPRGIDRRADVASSPC
jgi:hypothetical protein